MAQQPTHPIPDPSALTDEQRDGTACVVCGGDTAAMRPVGHVGGVQVFACASHGATWPDGEPTSVREAEEVMRRLRDFGRRYGEGAMRAVTRVLLAFADDLLDEEEAVTLVREVRGGRWREVLARLDAE